MTFKSSVLQYKTTSNWEENLDKLINFIKNSNSKIIVAPEVYLTNFSYDRFKKSVEFSKKSIEKLLPLSKDKIISFTINVEQNGSFFNQAIILYNGKIVHRQNKSKLFILGEELKYYKAGNIEDIKIFEIDGIRFGILICFELRFKELWKQLEKADFILVPAMWGKERKKQLEILASSLTVINQCYVLLANSSNDDMASSSGIISPFGDSFFDDNKDEITISTSLKEVKKMRRYIRIYE